MGYSDQQILEKSLECLKQDIPVVLVTVVESSGSTPARLGTKMLVHQDGSIYGTVGGGKLEKASKDKSLEILTSGQPEAVEYKLDTKDAESLGMVCGGRVKVFIEPILNAPRLILVGAGHISQEIVKLIRHLNFRITVIDDREEFANRDNFPDVDEVMARDVSSALAEYPIDSNSYIVIVTRGHKHDQTALEQVVHSDAKYIGMIGSKRKVHTVFENMKQLGVSEEKLSRIYAPIGLDLGGESPGEIAVSIISELVQVKNKGESDDSDK